MRASSKRIAALLVVALVAALLAGTLGGCKASGYYDGDDESSALYQLA